VPLRIALCGAGSAALRAHLPALARAEEAGTTLLVGVVDPDPQRRSLVAERCPAAGGFDDVEDMLDTTRPDLLVVATPPSSHLGAVRAAMSRGIDVLCEKPLGVAHGDAEALAELRAEHPRTLLAPVHQYRHAPAWALSLEPALREAVAGGEPLRVRVEVERPGTDPLSAGGWRAAGLREGGILGDHAVHYLALAWTVDPSLGVTQARLVGEPGRETADVSLALGRNGTASIHVTYAGQRRRNLIEAEIGGGRRLTWLDGELTVDGGEPGATAALSDRQAVNDLYGAMYEELVAQRGDAAYRGERGDETVAVAAALDAALEMVR
jgi:predicted dehydrogenase